ncbi:glucose 1-dehydrogenase [Geopseudomonas guangdongensis]|uniref:7-alpha-hydroxysteroid dehydrogenase n=1 Tax=Geopseudomonas guangdongensis TaxID=1245526 RepID=A0A1H2I1Z1_9GAMM|nr:glucose 1-dehydrogenase [Pseudomonas guangdongensis]SDU38181.1 7-alpha-hydroxysteroid dehydrogenase [Pseudomonas guangdongensis]
MSILQRFTLDGSVAVITGAGRGIGRAIALAYAENGADVVCAARTLADVEAVADEVRALGRRAIAVSCDVTDLAQREALVASAREQFGRITHLVNNAGGAGPNDPLKLAPERLEEILRFNVTSAYHLTQLCVPHMREAGGGNVINITSGAARYAQRQFSAYGTAKAALTQLTRLLAQDFAPQVRVNGIAPGPILTDALQRVMPAEMRAAMETGTPLGSLGEVEDIACAALYLASPAARWVTGKILEVDGGAENSVWPG